MGDDWTVGELIRVLCGKRGDGVSMDTNVHAKVWFNNGVNGKNLFNVDSFLVMDDDENGGLMIFCQVESEDGDAP